MRISDMTNIELSGHPVVATAFRGNTDIAVPRVACIELSHDTTGLLQGAYLWTNVLYKRALLRIHNDAKPQAKRGLCCTDPLIPSL